MPKKITVTRTEVASDEMGSAHQLLVTIPPFPDLTIDAVAMALKAERQNALADGNPRTLEDAAAFIAQQVPIDEKPEPLSRHYFLRQAQNQVLSAKERLEAIPEEWRSVAEQAANLAFMAARTLTEERNRQNYLGDVKKSKNQVKIAQKAGKERAKNVADRNEFIVDRMELEIAHGSHKIQKAAAAVCDDIRKGKISLSRFEPEDIDFIKEMTPERIRQTYNRNRKR